MSPAPTTRHQHISRRLAHLLDAGCRQRRAMGVRGAVTLRLLHLDGNHYDEHTVAKYGETPPVEHGGSG